MAVLIKQLTINTKVSKGAGGGDPTKGGKTSSKGMSAVEKELFMQECLQRVKEMIDYELRP